MKYLVTGAGLVGTALAARLRDDGHEVRLADVRMRPGVELLDVVDPDSFGTLVAEIDGIFHTAGLHGLSGASRRDFLEVNVRGTWNLCEAAVGAGVTRLVHSSTIGVFGTPTGTLLDDDSAVGRTPAPYDFSKRIAEDVVTWYAEVHGLEAVTLRYGAIKQTVAAASGDLDPSWARSGAVVDLGDVVEANVRAMDRLPTPRRAYLIVPTGGEPDGPYRIDSSAAEHDLGLRFAVPYLSIRDGAEVMHP